jgi:hypothetical protein
MFHYGVHAKYRTRKSAKYWILLVNVGGTFHFSTRVVGIFNIVLHRANDDVCPYVQVTACKSV